MRKFVLLLDSLQPTQTHQQLLLYQAEYLDKEQSISSENSLEHNQTLEDGHQEC